MSLAKSYASTFMRPRTERVPILSELDMNQLRGCARSPTASAQQRELIEELEAIAVLVDSAKVPPDVVTMNTTIECIAVGGTNAHLWTLVYPNDADYQRGRISVLSPAGLALLGARCGQTVVCLPPSGVPVQYLISRILFQPERSA